MLRVTEKNIIKIDLNKDCLTKSEAKYTVNVNTFLDNNGNFNFGHFLVF